MKITYLFIDLNVRVVLKFGNVFFLFGKLGGYLVKFWWGVIGMFEIRVFVWYSRKKLF